MPTFDELESSREDGKPILLFYVRYGPAAANFYAYTNAEEPVVWGNVTYKPVTTDHSGFKQSGSLDQSQTTWILPQNNELAMRFRGWPPSEVISLRVYQGHLDNSDFRLCWTGRILNGKVNEREESELTLERINTALQRTGLRRRYGLICPYLLYSQGEGACNADREAATSAHQATGVDGSFLTLGASWTALGDKRDKFTNGVVSWVTPDGRTERRQIVEIMPQNQIALNGPAFGIVSGDQVSMTLGCNHLLDDCTDLHHNSRNYGGQWLIPLTNPIGVKNNF